jgi:hypothetical protein
VTSAERRARSLETEATDGKIGIVSIEQILKEIEALPKEERQRLVQRMRESVEIPQDFIEAMEDFAKQRFVSMETALNEKPPPGA